MQPVFVSLTTANVPLCVCVCVCDSGAQNQS